MSQRLEDPLHLVPPQELDQLRKKLSGILTGMMLSKDLGGNPFIFALTAAKPHILIDKLPGVSDWKTAATNGRVFFWHPEFVRRLTDVAVGKDKISEMRIVMEHEAYHNVFWHCAPERGAGKNMDLWALAIDYVVNTVVWMDHKPIDQHAYQRNNGGTNLPAAPHPRDLFKGSLGTPIGLQELIDITTGKTPKAQHPPYPWCFVDEAVDRKSADWIYEQLYKSLPNWLPEFTRCSQCSGRSGRRVTDGQGGKCNHPDMSPLDGHIPPEITQEQAKNELMAAHEKAKMMGRGDQPGAIMDMIKELQAPTLAPHDIIQAMVLQRIQDEGANKDFRRYRRRFIAGQPQQWIPHNYDFRPKWLSGLDTSGSMSTDDMAAGIKELQLVGSESEGLVVPMDAQPYWDDATPIQRVEELQHVAIKGRGGTVFCQFFEEMHEKVGYEWDVVIIITDGAIDHIPANLAPPCDVLWLITNDNIQFQPEFGRVIRLKR